MATQPPVSTKDIQFWSGLTKGVVYRRIVRLREARKIRIAEWSRTPEGVPGKFTALFALCDPDNPKKDAPKPKWRPRDSHSERALAYEEVRNKRRMEKRLFDAYKRAVANHGHFAAQLL